MSDLIFALTFLGRDRIEEEEDLREFEDLCMEFSDELN